MVTAANVNEKRDVAIWREERHCDVEGRRGAGSGVPPRALLVQRRDKGSTTEHRATTHLDTLFFHMDDAEEERPTTWQRYSVGFRVARWSFPLHAYTARNERGVPAPCLFLPLGIPLLFLLATSMAATRLYEALFAFERSFPVSSLPSFLLSLVSFAIILFLLLLLLRLLLRYSSPQRQGPAPCRATRKCSG